MPAPAFNVVKNVNDGRAPEEKLVLFDKGKPHDHIIVEDKVGNCKTGFTPDGAIEIIITGNTPIQPTISWKPTGKIPESFNAREYNFLILTCALEGDIKRTSDKGTVSSTRADNLWLGVTLYDPANVRSGTANLATVSSDKRTPDKLVTLVIPMSLLSGGAFNDITKITGIGFPWNKTHDYNNRDFRLVIEKIALAN
jgi:hypothetical protein